MIYTTYFARLKHLPENVMALSIARTQPRGIELPTVVELKPDPDLLADWKLHDIDWLKYTIRYNKQLHHLDPHKLVEGFFPSGVSDVALVCWESPEKKCHRHLVAQWLRKHGYEVQEYQ